MSKHTSAPWKIEEDPSGNHVILAKNEWEICTVWEDHSKADSLLIAAAPDLLAALNAMLTHMGMDEDEWTKPAFDQARAAITKATGEKK